MDTSDVISGLAVFTSARIAKERTDCLADSVIEFENGTRARLTGDHPRYLVLKSILERRIKSKMPVAMRLLADSIVDDLYIPRVYRVISVSSPEDGEVQVELELSHAVSKLKATHKQFDVMLSLLLDAIKRDGPLLITHAQQNIVDVTSTSIPLPEPTVGEERVQSPPQPVSLEKVLQWHRLVSLDSCNPKKPGAKCIPFLFPDDGCWARAHDMCRQTTIPQKVWIRAVRPSKLNVMTPNSPECGVTWYWHVAPLVTVADALPEREYVVDPSLFPNAPVPLAEWCAKQSGNATLQTTSARTFAYTREGSPIFDDDFSKTESVLQDYRDALELRSSHPAGPPPYGHCAVAVSKSPPSSTFRSPDAA
jgi:glutaminase-like protein